MVASNLRATVLVMLVVSTAVVAADTAAGRHGRNGGGRKIKLGRSSSQMDLAKLARDSEPKLVQPQSVVEVAALRGGFADNDDMHETTGSVLVKFAVDCVHVSQYEDVQVGIVGGCPELGLWTNVITMDSEDWPTWHFEVLLDKKYRQETIEYKYVKVDSDGTVAEWEPGKNRYNMWPPGSV